jgi:hypothetical protein
LIFYRHALFSKRVDIDKILKKKRVPHNDASVMILEEWFLEW